MATEKLNEGEIIQVQQELNKTPFSNIDIAQQDVKKSKHR